MRERLRDHRATPHHGLLGVHQEADRHRRHPVGHERFQALAIGRQRLLTFEPEHKRLAGAIDVRIEDPHPCTLRGPGESQIHSNGRFTYPALARGDGHDVFDVAHGLQVALHGVRANVRLQLDFQGQLYPQCRKKMLQCFAQLRKVAPHGKAQGKLGDVTRPADANPPKRTSGTESFPEVRVDIARKGAAQACKIRVVRHVRPVASGGREYGIILTRSLRTRQRSLPFLGPVLILKPMPHPRRSRTAGRDLRGNHSLRKG